MFSRVLTLASYPTRYFKMFAIDGMEDIAASLGLGQVLACPPSSSSTILQVPLLNAENRELNRQLQELQVREVFLKKKAASFWTLSKSGLDLDLLVDPTGYMRQFGMTGMTRLSVP